AQDGTTKIDADFEHAPERIRDLMRSCYELPICKLTVDANGRETHRDVVATAPAKAILVDNGAITNALLFHPPYHADENQWQAPAAMSIGGVNVAEGELTFTRSPGKDGKDGLATFTVAGTLTKAEIAKPRTPFVEKGFRHVVVGKQSYDPALREWVWGS